MEYDRHIFVEIVAQQDRGGASIDLIRDGVDYRQKMLLTETEMDEALKRLAAGKLIRTDGEKYFVAKSIVPSLPKTASGKLSFQVATWDKLWPRLYKK